MSFKWWTADEENPINSKRITFWCTISSSIYISQVVAVAIIRSSHLITSQFHLSSRTTHEKVRRGNRPLLCFFWALEWENAGGNELTLLYTHVHLLFTTQILSRLLSPFPFISFKRVTGILLVFHRHHQLCVFFYFVSQGGINCRINRPLTSVFNEL